MGPFARLSARVRQCGLAAIVVSLLAFSICPVLAQSSIETTGDSPADSSSGVVSIGGQVVMRLRSSAGGMSAEERVDAIEDRLTKIVAVPDIKTSDVIVYLPAGKPPVIYVLGRRLITVDSATVKSAGGGSAKQLATVWAKRLQQILPRVDIRLPNEPEPDVPANPPLTMTSDLSKVEGDVGDVVLRGKTVIRFHGVQPGGITAAERADMLSERLNRLANKLDTTAQDAVSVSPVIAATQQASSKTAPTAKSAASTKENSAAKSSPIGADTPVQLLMGGKLVYTVTKADTKVAGGGTTQSLAESWAKNIRAALGIPPNGAPPAPATPSAPSTLAGPPPPPPAGVLPPPPAASTPPSTAMPATPTTPPDTAVPSASAQPATPPAPTKPAPDTPAQPSTPAGPQGMSSPAPSG